jgi:hypothetical protein
MGLESGLYKSSHQFAAMLSDSINVYAKPRSDSELILQLKTSSVVRINESITTQYNTWKQAQLVSHNSGWIKLKQAAVKNLPEKILFRSAFYSYRIIDLISVILGLAGFIWGFKSGTT